MGSKKIFLLQLLKQVAALASVLGVIGGLSDGFVSAQTSQYQSLNRSGQTAASALPVYQGSAIITPTYSQRPALNSARIFQNQPPMPRGAQQQATVSRRALVGQGRMISAGYPQDPVVPGQLPRSPDQTVLQGDDGEPDFFGDNQLVPTPSTQESRQPAPTNPRTRQRQNGELPPNVFRDPFQDERRNQLPEGPVKIPSETLIDPPEDPDNRDLEDPNVQQSPNPFTPESKRDEEIDYLPGRGFSSTRNRSNTYKAPGSDDVLESGQGVYFVPAYDPIPGTYNSTLAPPATMDSYHGFPQQQAWPNQYGTPGQPPRYAYPQHQQPQYAHPQYQQPQYQQPPQGYAADQAMPPEQQVYTPVVQPANMACNNGLQGPMTTARRGLWGKLKQDLKKDFGFGDYQSCQDAGNCGGCNVGCGGGTCGGKATCPVFYFGFQAAGSDAFDVANDQGSELELDTGTAFFFSLGRMNGRNLRTEVELSFRSNDVSSLLTPGGEIPMTGQLQTFSGMANAYWEFVNFPAGRFKPYFGGGVGFLSATTDLRLPSASAISINDTDSSSSFAYQWMAGLNFKVSNHLDLFGEYRFVDAESFGIPSDRDDLSGDFGYSANSVGGGLRWKF